MKKEGLTPDEMEHILNQESGTYGISGVSKDNRDICKAEKGKIKEIQRQRARSRMMQSVPDADYLLSVCTLPLYHALTS